MTITEQKRLLDTLAQAEGRRLSFLEATADWLQSQPGEAAADLLREVRVQSAESRGRIDGLLQAAALAGVVEGRLDVLRSRYPLEGGIVKWKRRKKEAVASGCPPGAT